MVTVINRPADPDVHGGRMAAGDPQGIILHHDGAGKNGEAGSIAWLSHYHANPVSTNQYVKRDGTIVQIVANNLIAWHAGLSQWMGRDDCNAWCIGIEIANAGDGVEPYTVAEYESVSQTVAYLCALYHIPDHNVTSHARVALPAGRKNDPLGWDWARFWKRVDAIRATWPYAPEVPEWHEVPIRVMSTV